MGIQQTKTLLKNYYSKPSPKDPDSYLQKGFCPEALQLTEFLDHFWDISANEHFDWTNIQENKKTEEIQKEKEKFYIREKYILPELPDNKLISDNMFSIETLSDNKEAYNPYETSSFSLSFIKRMNIILFAYVKKIISTLNESSSLDCMGKYFETSAGTESKALYDLGMNLFVKMLEDETLTKTNKKLKGETLDFMLNTMVYVRPLNFFGETKDFFMLDKSLDQIVNYLKKIISDPTEEKIMRIKAYKILLNMGLAKGSLKNLLDFVKLYDHLDDFVDLNTEINIFKNEFIKLSLSDPGNVICKSKLWNFKLSQKSKKKEAVADEISNKDHLSITSDGSYVYIFGATGYLIKVGTGHNNTMLGNVYAIRENFRTGEKGSIALIENVLYYRSATLDPDPLLCLDSDSLGDIAINYNLNIREPNHLWIESKINDIEFPHENFKELSELIEKKKNMGSEDKANKRPLTQSPMTTDGRYIYILSKWFDDYDTNLLEKAQDDDDDEPKNMNKKAILSIYGVDVYDALNHMCVVKSLKLKPMKCRNEANICLNDESAGVPDLLASGVVYTNGNIIVIGKLKFSLITGEETLDPYQQTSADQIKSACYDLVNNVIWGISRFQSGGINNQNLEIICYFNHSAKPIVEYPNNHAKYMPCSLEKIIHLAEEYIKLENLTDKISVKKFKRETTLNILSLEDVDSELYKKQNLLLAAEPQIKGNLKINENKITLYKKSVKCLILATIAKLSEYFGQVPDIRSANTDEERGLIFSKACRRPFCVKLESETFENLIIFINNFSESFFKIIEKKNNYTKKDQNTDKEENEKINEDDQNSELEMLDYLDAYCLLSTIKILRTNLSCLSLSNLDLKFFIKDNNNNPFLKVKEFIFKILELYNHKINFYEKNKQDVSKLEEIEKKNFDIIKALYEECKTILLVSINTFYPEYNDIIEILETEIINFKTSNYSRDVVNCILEWMSSEENMKNLLLKLKSDQISKIFEIFRTVSGWEVKNFSVYLRTFKDFSLRIPKYSASTHDEITAFKFSSNMQTEILKSISKKLFNENYDDIENELLLKSFSEIIFENVLVVFEEITNFLGIVKDLIKADYNRNKKAENVENFIDDEEVIDTFLVHKKVENLKIDKKNSKEEKNNKKEKTSANLTLEEYTNLKIKDICNFIMDKLIGNNLLIIKIFNFHIESLSILTSNFIISSLMLNSFNSLISEMNKIYKIIKEYEAIKITEEKERDDYKELILESDHPYANNQTVWYTIDIPGEKELFIEIDPRSDLKPNCDFLNFYTDTRTTLVFPDHTTLNQNNFPKEPLTCSNPPIEMFFNSDACANSANLWGFRVKVHNGCKNSTEITNDKFTNLMRSVCWVSSKCSAQMLRGSFTKPVSVGNDEDDAKYNNLLSSKLFAGGLEFEEIRKENDQNISNVLEILEKIVPEKTHEIEAPAAFTEKSLLLSIVNGDNENANKVLSALQKKFSEETVWAHIGGAQADRLVRAAFASLLRHSGQAKDFKQILDLIDFSEEVGEEKESTENLLGLNNIDVDNKVNKVVNSNSVSNTLNLNLSANLISVVSSHKKFASIFKKWQAASRMRTWLVEKKKNVDEALEKANPNTATLANKKDEISTLEITNNPSLNANSNLQIKEIQSKIINISNSLNIADAQSDENNSSEDIMNKIIDQTVIKAKFLIKLIPSPAFLESLSEDAKHKNQNSTTLIRSSSLNFDQNGSQDDSLKTRLSQWKLLQKSKKIIRSVEEEASEKLTSLTSSVLLTLQSTISSKRLFNKIKIATLRAKAREIGLITLKNIFQETSHSSLIKDLLSWFCAALRKTDNKICHYLDNLSGCGRYFETRIEKSFHEFIILLIQKLINIEDTVELKSFVDALMWRYSGSDHKFLVEQAIFLILRGSYNSNVKSAWGKPLKPTIEIPELVSIITGIISTKEFKEPNYDFTKSILELFEILSNICIEKATVSQWEKQKQEKEKNNLIAINSAAAPTKGPVNIKFPSLERTISSIDENYSESLVTHILDVIFGEAANAVSSYLKFRGISYPLWQQYEQYEEEKTDVNKKKKKFSNSETPGTRNRTRRVHVPLRETDQMFNDDLSEERSIIDELVEEGEEIEASEEDNNQINEHNVIIDNSNNKYGENKDNKINSVEEKPYFYEASEKINLYDELKFEEGLGAKGFVAAFSSLNASNAKVNITLNELLKLVNIQNEAVYDPEFLNRLLIILYKCSTQHHNEKILFNIANPLSFCILFKLIRVCSTPEKILIVKTLINICPHIPEEILIEGIDLFLKDLEKDEFVNAFSTKRKKYANFDKNIFIEFIIDLISDIRIKCWNKETESSGAYIVSSYLINLLRVLWQCQNWKILINNLFNDLINDLEELNFANSASDEKEEIDFTSKEKYLLIRKIIRKEIILGIFGGEYNGLATGAEIKVKNELSQNLIDLDFIKKEYTENYNSGTILGFSQNMEEIWTKKSTKDIKIIKKNANAIYLTPNNNMESQVCVLLKDSILKDEFNLIDIQPKIYNQQEIIVIQQKINFENLTITAENLEKILKFVINSFENEDSKKNINVLLNLRADYLRFLDKLFRTNKGIALLAQMDPEVIAGIISKISEISNKKVVYGNHILNLELLEEKRFRLINHCLENKTGLNELDVFTAAFKKPNHLVIRINKDHLINLTYQVINATNYDSLGKLTEFKPVGIDDKLNANVNSNQNNNENLRKRKY
jgi:hypothetical protein